MKITTVGIDLAKSVFQVHAVGGSELSRKLEKIPGIGPLGASALVASIADANSFENGRQLSAWLGLMPRQDSSGGKPKLLGISKRGGVYLRTLLIHGARSAILAAQRKSVNTNVWLAKLLDRRHPKLRTPNGPRRHPYRQRNFTWAQAGRVQGPGRSFAGSTTIPTACS